VSKLAKRKITEQICETHLFFDQTSEAAAAAAREEFTKKPHG
jgi:hypothetical protein